MSTKEELLRELAKWTKEYVETNEKQMNLLPPVANLTDEKVLIFWNPTMETLSEWDETERRKRTAQTKRRRIIHELIRRRPV
jgi:hypothetical protein